MEDTPHTITIDELLFASIPSNARRNVIEASVTIERVVGVLLARFLEIDSEDSVSFGMAASALSFNHKINLLTDMKIIGKNEKTLLNKFAEIRNLFAHNAVVINFYQCFEYNNLRNFLVKKYGEQKSEFGFEESNCELLFQCLYNDVLQVCRDLFNKMMQVAGDRGTAEGKIIYHEKLLEKINAFCRSDEDFRIKMERVYNGSDEAFRDAIKKTK